MSDVIVRQPGFTIVEPVIESDTFNARHRAAIRRVELDMVLPHLRPGEKVLELGAGAGWQAKVIAQRGMEVIAIDVPSNPYAALREWPVITYDGTHIPCTDGSMDVVFSSNVLEHVPAITDFQKEILRVLKPGGCAIHIMPSPAWRFWSYLTFYLFRLKQLILFLSGRSGSMSRKSGSSNMPAHSAEPARRAMLGKLAPAQHGVRGNLLSEMYYFSTRYWTKMFRGAGWKIDGVVPNRIFYTGYRVFGPRLPLSARRRLSLLLGSSTVMYVLRKPEV